MTASSRSPVDPIEIRQFSRTLDRVPRVADFGKSGQ